MKKLVFSWNIPKRKRFLEMEKDLTQFFGLIRKLSKHGWSKSQIKAMIGNAFWYDNVKNNLSKDIEIWLLGRINRIIELNPHLGEDENIEPAGDFVNTSECVEPW